MWARAPQATGSGPWWSGRGGRAPPSLNDARLTEAAPRQAAHGAARRVIAAMAMSGLRVFTVAAGLVDQTPPQAIAKQKARGLLRYVPKKKRQAAVELAHWGYGAAAGATFGTLPHEVRRRAWSGPAYGLLIWLGYEAGLAPALGLSQAKRARPVERGALAADHLLYGFVLSGMRDRPPA